MSGGNFTATNIEIYLFWWGNAQKRAEVDVSAAGRKLLHRGLCLLRDANIQGVKSVLSGGVEQSVPHTLFQNEILSQRQREAGSSRTKK